MVTERADIWWFGSTVGYNLTPHYRLLGSLHVIEIFKTLAAKNMIKEMWRAVGDNRKATTGKI